ncbi:hypothetical protein WJX74_000878 [Apatococcus lobatus]|uniref:Uncharacterized protein n=2 Tax=Apatococcus TaxID=904362 RepID=A0AAW1T9I3_9CHLO
MLNFVIAAVRGSTRRVPRAGATQLNSKRGPRNYYKGKGARATGRHTSKGRYVIDPDKLPNYVVPDLTGFQLKAYVAHEPKPIKR